MSVDRDGVDRDGVDRDDLEAPVAGEPPIALAAEASSVIESSGALPVFRGDPDRAFALDLHRKPGSRRAILEEVVQRGPRELAPHLARLLADDDLEVVRFALGVGEHAYGPSALEVLIASEPELAPAGELRSLTNVARDITIATVKALSRLHLPEDAELVLDILIAEGSSPTDLEWLAPLERSAGLAPVLDTKEAYEVIRRRRCAGLAVELDHRDVVRQALTVRPGPFGIGLSSKLAIEHAARIVADVGDGELADELVVAIDLDVDAGVLVPVFGLLGDAGRTALDRAIAADASERELIGDDDLFANAPSADRLGRGRRLAAIREAIECWQRPHWMTVAGGDDRFAAGNLEDGLLVDHAAYASYAYALRTEPRCAHAAFQLAWIDRGFGTPIAAQRIAWIRSLGYRDLAMLDELARPVVPLPSWRFTHAAPQTDRPAAFAPRAEAAGLPAVAATYWTLAGRTADAERAHAATQRHLERVRAATA